MHSWTLANLSLGSQFSQKKKFVPSAKGLDSHCKRPRVRTAWSNSLYHLSLTWYCRGYNTDPCQHLWFRTETGGVLNTCILGWLRVAYPWGETSLRGPEGRIWPDDFSKIIFPGGPWLIEVARQLLVEVRCGKNNKTSLQLSLTLACTMALSKPLPNIHGASHFPAPPRAPANVVHWTLVRSPREDFFWKIIRPNSSFGAPEESLTSGVRNAWLGFGERYNFFLISSYNFFLYRRKIWWENQRDMRRISGRETT